MAVIRRYEILRLTPEEFQFYPEDASARDRKIEEIRVTREPRKLRRVSAKNSSESRPRGGGVSLASILIPRNRSRNAIGFAFWLGEKNDLLAYSASR